MSLIIEDMKWLAKRVVADGKWRGGSRPMIEVIVPLTELRRTLHILTVGERSVVVTCLHANYKVRLTGQGAEAWIRLAEPYFKLAKK